MPCRSVPLPEHGDETRGLRKKELQPLRPQQDEIGRRNVARLASLLANGVKVLAGHTYPNGWDPRSRRRVYALATTAMIEEAKRLAYEDGSSTRALKSRSQTASAT